MDKDNRVGVDCGSRGVGVGGMGRAMGENWDNCNKIIIKKTYQVILLDIYYSSAGTLSFIPET